MNALAVSASMLPALVVGVSFAAGLNTYATLLGLGAMSRMGLVTLPVGLGAVDDWWVMGACGFLFVGEFVADKIPGFDVIWNLLHTFVRVPVAAVVAFAAGSTLPVGMQVMVTVLGAGFAAVAHGSKTALRVAVMPSPEPVSNVALSMAEDGVAVWLSWVALRHPVVGAVAVVGLTVVAAGLAWWGMRWIRVGWARRFRDRRVAAEGGFPNQTMPSDLRHPEVSVLDGEVG